MYVCIYIYIHTCIERQRERERDIKRERERELSGHAACRSRSGGLPPYSFNAGGSEGSTTNCK